MNDTKTKIVVELGTTTMVMMAQIIAILLKVTNYISYSWEIILAPLGLILFVAVISLIVSAINLVKKTRF